jgi:sarcosine oxidase
MRYDVAVVGLGGMGSATLAHLARRGVRAIGIERFERLHENGASTGETRIIRKAYFENAAYVPLLERAYQLWHDLERESGRSLVDLVGVLLVGAPERESIAGAQETAKRYDLPLEVFDSQQLGRVFPGTLARREEIGLLERNAGMVFPELALDTHLDIATLHGAEMVFESQVKSLERSDGAHVIGLADGTTIEAARVIFCPGMWAQALLTELALPLRVQRNVQIWFEPTTSHYDRGSFPAFLLERLDLPGPLYGFPAINGALKAALHKFGHFVDPEKMDRRIRDEDVMIVGNALDEWLAGAAGSYVRGRVCTYTLTPDANFIVDTHPQDPSIVIGCGFSGHGYKFCPVIGELLTQLALDGGTPYDIEFLRMSRFTSAPA